MIKYDGFIEVYFVITVLKLFTVHTAFLKRLRVKVLPGNPTMYTYIYSKVGSLGALRMYVPTRY